MATPTVPTIPADASLETVWHRAVYSEQRLLKNPLTADLAPPFAALAARCRTEIIAQLGHWGAEIGAQAGADEADDALDDTTNEIVAEIRHADRKATGARLKRYLGNDTASGIVRLGLSSQLKVVRAWPKALSSEPEAALQALGTTLAQDIATGETADAERVTVAGERATHRARNITSLIDDLNALRATTLGRLITRGTKHKKPADWPRRFFYQARTRGSAKGGAPDAPAKPDPVAP
ncbi:MAG: hypothetical protein JWM10_2578 [Myxococcaceae bacterium]|nr:hypothetical protein [Myxococcaceae bacterium]